MATGSLAIPTVFVTAALSIVGALVLNATADTKAAIKEVSTEVRTLRDDLYAFKIHMAAKTGTAPDGASPWEQDRKKRTSDNYSHK